MKNILFTFSLLLLSSCLLAQHKNGLIIGINSMDAAFVIGKPMETKHSWGIGVGYVSEYKLTGNLFVRGAALFNQRGFRFAGERWGVNAFDVPLNLGYAIPLNDKHHKLFLDAGVNLEYNLYAFTKLNEDLIKLEVGQGANDIRPFAQGLNFGGGYQFSETKKIRLSYYQGLTNLLRSPVDSWKNSTISVFMIFFFKGGR